VAFALFVPEVVAVLALSKRYPEGGSTRGRTASSADARVRLGLVLLDRQPVHFPCVVYLPA
jgi:hypothetical protein